MRIISDYRDYYDSIQGVGFDESKVYERKTTEDYVLVETQYSFPEGRHYLSPKFSFLNGFTFGALLERSYGVTINCHVILITGRAYQVNVMEVNDLRTGGKVYTGAVKSLDDVLSKVSEIKDQKPNIIENELSKIYYRYNGRIGTRDLAKIDRILKAEPVDIGNELFFEYGSPVLEIVNPRWRDEPPKAITDQLTQNTRALKVISNPRLLDVHFQSIVDPYTAFQDISLFLSGVLGEAHPPMVDISDEDMKTAKGFGHKYAFKNEPTKKRK